MASQGDVRRIAIGLPEVTEEQADVVAIRVDGEMEKESLIAMDPEAFFTEPHYHGFPAILVRLPNIEPAMLEDLLVKGWRIQAGKRLASTLDR